MATMAVALDAHGYI